MSTEAVHPRASDFVIRDALILVGTLGGAYGISQFLRNSIGVIAPNLATELHLSASEIGVLSSVFFFSFAAAQIPLGLALDHYGPRRCMLVCAAVAVAGALLFALGAVACLADFRARADGARRFLLFHGAACALCKALSARSFRDRGEFSIRARDAWHPACDRALRLGGRGDRLARLLHLDSGCHAGSRSADCDRNPPRPACSRPRQHNLARERDRNAGGNAGALVLAALCHAIRHLFELCDRGRAVGRAVSHTYLRLQPDRARQHAAGGCGLSGDRGADLGPERPLVSELQGPGDAGRVADRGNNGLRRHRSGYSRPPD